MLPPHPWVALLAKVKSRAQQSSRRQILFIKAIGSNLCSKQIYVKEGQCSGFANA
jgi:hypothetical protein